MFVTLPFFKFYSVFFFYFKHVYMVKKNQNEIKTYILSYLALISVLIYPTTSPFIDKHFFISSLFIFLVFLFCRDKYKICISFLPYLTQKITYFMRVLQHTFSSLTMYSGAYSISRHKESLSF